MMYLRRSQIRIYPGPGEYSSSQIARQLGGTVAHSFLVRESFDDAMNGRPETMSVHTWLRRGC